MDITLEQYYETVQPCDYDALDVICIINKHGLGTIDAYSLELITEILLEGKNDK